MRSLEKPTQAHLPSSQVKCLDFTPRLTLVKPGSRILSRLSLPAHAGHGKRTAQQLCRASETATLLRECDTLIDTYCMHYSTSSRASQTVPDPPLTTIGALRAGVAGGRGQLSCQRQMASADRSVAAPHLKKNATQRGVPAVLLLEIGGYDCKVTPKAPKTYF